MEETMFNNDVVDGGLYNPTQSQPPLNEKINLPGNRDPDAEVIALSPKTLMARHSFSCEICHKGFQREQNLQLHRRGHNLALDLKQKNKEEVSRKKVYVCPEPSCVHHDPSRALGDLMGIKKHFSRKHGEKKWKCEKCSMCYGDQSDFEDHTKSCETREYRCECNELFSRRDDFITHRAFCDALSLSTSNDLQWFQSPFHDEFKLLMKIAQSGPPPPQEPQPSHFHDTRMGSFTSGSGFGGSSFEDAFSGILKLNKKDNQETMKLHGAMPISGGVNGGGGGSGGDGGGDGVTARDSLGVGAFSFEGLKPAALYLKKSDSSKKFEKMIVGLLKLRKKKGNSDEEERL